MTHFLLRVVINAIALLIVAYFMPGVHVTGPVGALEAALVLGVVNAILRPILIILTLPVQILTLGLFTLIVNGFLFWWVAHWNVGLSVDGFWTSVLASIVLTVISMILSWVLGGITREKV